MPFLLKIVILGNLNIVLLSFFIPILRLSSSDLNRYIPIIFFAIFIAYKDIILKLNNLCKNIFLWIILLIILFGIYITTGIYYIIEPFIILIICVIVNRVKNKNFENIFSFLGKHSTNIFLMHTFIYYYYAKNFIYAPSKFILIFFLLLFCSIICSQFINLIKKIIKYDSIIDTIIDKMLIFK